MSSSKLDSKLNQIIDRDLQPKTSKRTDCPNCGGKNTLSITNLGTIILFYCFKANCNLKGKRLVEASISSLKQSFTVPKTESPTLCLNNFLFIPEMSGKSRITDYLHKINAWEAYRDGRADIRYDPHEDRVVFLIYKVNDSLPTSGCGRKLSGKGPKWKRYGKNSIPFICQTDRETKSKTLIIVEDCASACAASAYMDTAALLGTFLQANYLPEFLHYEKFIVALDKDASRLSFKMQQELHYYRPTKIITLEEDLKCYNAPDIRKIFNA